MFIQQTSMADSGQQGLDLHDVDSANDSFLLMSYLDEVEDRVEELRRNALSISQERDSLLAVLVQLKEDRLKCSLTGDESYEMLTRIGHLRRRCEDVEMNIRTSRTPEQETSYLSVNTLVTELEHTCRLAGPANLTCIDQAKGFLNACVSDGVPQGPVDYKFQGMILGCKLEDQKFVRQRLQCLVKGDCHTDLAQHDLDSHAPCTNGHQGEEDILHDQHAENSDIPVTDVVGSNSH